jgi:hypothetical protein
MAASVEVRNHHTRLVLISLLAFAALAVAHTWPLASAPAHWSRIDNGDAALNIWAVNWVGSHLLHDPAHLFEANIFYPERHTLAYSEMMLVQGLLAVPIVELGGSPVLAFNLVLLAGLTFTGWAFCLLLQRWTGSWTAGFLAGSLAAFNAHALVRFGHLQIMHVEFFALMLFALDRLIRTRQLKDAVWLGVGFALQGLTSLYLLMFSAWALIFAVLSRAAEWWRAGAVGAVLRFGVAALVAAMLLWPYLRTYQQLRSDSGLERGVVEQIAGSWSNYLATGARLHRWWVPADAAASQAYGFPGVMAMLLVVFALTRADTRTDPRVRMCAVVAVGCLAVSMAPRWPLYPALHRAIPLFQAVRVPAHLAQVVLLMVAVLAGFGVAALGRRWPTAARWPVGVALVLLVNAEAFRAPIGFTHFDAVPAVYETLAHERNAVVAELPFPMGQQWFLNAQYMVYSTKHWRPMLNGYSGFMPKSYEKSYEATRGFPAQESLIALHDRGVTHVIVHRKALGDDRVAQIARIHELQEIASEGDIAIYRFRRVGDYQQRSNSGDRPK